MNRYVVITTSIYFIVKRVCARIDTLYSSITLYDETEEACCPRRIFRADAAGIYCVRGNGAAKCGYFYARRSPLLLGEAPKLPDAYNANLIPEVVLPWFEKIRAEGKVFNNAYTSGPMCAPSRFNLMTGRFCSRSGYAQSRSSGPDGNMVDVTVPNCKVNDDSALTLAHVFAAAEYSTIFSGKWHISKYPQGKSSAGWNDYAGVVDLVKDAGFNTVAGVYHENIDNPESLGFSHNNEWLVNQSTAAIEDARATEKPFFLYFAPTAPHTPSTQQALFDFSVRDTPAGTLENDPLTPNMPSRSDVWNRAKGNDLAAGSLWVDDALGALYKAIDDVGEIDNTIFVVLTDHGMVAKQSLYETGTRTLMVAKYGSRIFPGSVDDIVSNLDIAPSVLQAAGLSIPDWMEGNSWWSLVASQDTAASGRDAAPCIISEINADRAVVAKDMSSGHVMKLQVKDKDSAVQNRVARYYAFYDDLDQLYDLTEDPAETTNLVSNPAYADTFKEMKAYLDCHNRDTGVGSSRRAVGSICDVRNMKQLGVSSATTSSPSLRPTSSPTELQTDTPTELRTGTPTELQTEAPTVLQSSLPSHAANTLPSVSINALILIAAATLFIV